MPKEHRWGSVPELSADIITGASLVDIKAIELRHHGCLCNGRCECAIIRIHLNSF